MRLWMPSSNRCTFNLRVTLFWRLCLVQYRPKTETFVVGLRIIDKHYSIIRCSGHRRHGIKKPSVVLYTIVHSLFLVEIICKLNCAHTLTKTFIVQPFLPHCSMQAVFLTAKVSVRLSVRHTRELWQLWSSAEILIVCSQHVIAKPCMAAGCGRSLPVWCKHNVT